MRYLFCCLFIYITTILHAQNYQGSVVDSNTNKALDIVVVGILKADSITMNFVYTDTNGRFYISSPSNIKGSYLSFSLLGYEPRIVPIKDFHNGMQIPMKSKTFKIREVKVTAERIKERKDTLIYSVSGFKMPQDKSIADVLKKMPGIEVKSNGSIQYQGKNINKFYIEGMNLLEGKYSLASNNLSADMVKEVQILRNHQPIRALKGVNFSDQAALNLILKDNAKAHLIGTADIGLGTTAEKHPDVLWDNRLIAMIFGSHHQNLSMYKNNNTGKNIQSELNTFTQEAYQRRRDIYSETGFLSTKETGSELPQNRQLFNNAHLITTNHLWKPNKDNDLRLQLSYLHDRRKSESEINTTYLFPGEKTIVNELNKNINTENELNGELTYQKNTPSLYINNVLKGYGSFITGLNNILVNKQKQQQTIKPKEQLYREDFELIRRNGDRSLSISSINSYTDMPQTLLMSPGPDYDLLNEQNDYKSLLQNIDFKTFNSHTYTYLQHKLWNLFIKYKIGVQIRYQSLNSDMEQQKADSWEVLTNNLFINNTRYLETDVYVEPSLNYGHNGVNIEFSMKASVKNMRVKNESAAKETNKETHFLPQPYLSISYQATPFWKIRGNASYTYSFGDIHQLYSGYIFTSYRAADIYSNNFSINKKQSYGLNLEYCNPLSGFFFFLNGSYSPTHRNMFYEHTLNGILMQQKVVYQPIQSKTYYLSGRINKAYTFWKTNLSLSSFYMSFKNAQILQGELIPYRSETISNLFSLSTQPCRYLNFEESSSYTFTKLHSDIESKPVHNFQHSLVCNILPTDKWKIRWNNELYHSTDKSVSSTFFSDLSVYYSAKTWEAGIDIQNIFNNHSFQREYIQSIQETYIRYILRPREIMCKLTVSF